MCGVGAGSFASFPCQNDRARKNNDRVGPTRLEIAVWQGRGATFRAGNSQNNSKEVLGMAKWFSAKETIPQRCQIRKGGSKAETAQWCQKEKSTARECQTARWARRQSERTRNADHSRAPVGQLEFFPYCWAMASYVFFRT